MIMGFMFGLYVYFPYFQFDIATFWFEVSLNISYIWFALVGYGIPSFGVIIFVALNFVICPNIGIPFHSDAFGKGFSSWKTVHVPK